jgi:hypothetical protein
MFQHDMQGAKNFANFMAEVTYTLERVEACVCGVHVDGGRV